MSDNVEIRINDIRMQNATVEDMIEKLKQLDQNKKIKLRFSNDFGDIEYLDIIDIYTLNKIDEKENFYVIS